MSWLLDGEVEVDLGPWILARRALDLGLWILVLKSLEREGEPLGKELNMVKPILPEKRTRFVRPGGTYQAIKCLPILSYIPSGLQIWDCTDLGTVTEVLNLNFYQRPLAEFDGRSVV